jgi:hypothetical protein
MRSSKSSLMTTYLFKSDLSTNYFDSYNVTTGIQHNCLTYFICKPSFESRTYATVVEDAIRFCKSEIKRLT